jgi:hypothetical protein
MKENGLELLKEMMNTFEFEMEADGYDIECCDGEEYHYIIEDAELMGWDYVHGAKRLIEYFFCMCEEDTGKYVYGFCVEAEFKNLEPEEITLITGEKVNAPRMDIKFLIKKDESGSWCIKSN